MVVSPRAPVMVTGKAPASAAGAELLSPVASSAESSEPQAARASTAVAVAAATRVRRRREVGRAEETDTGCLPEDVEVPTTDREVIW